MTDKDPKEDLMERNTISAPPSFWEQIDREAAENGLNRSAYVRFIIKQYYVLKASGTPTPPKVSVVA